MSSHLRRFGADAGLCAEVARAASAWYQSGRYRDYLPGVEDNDRIVQNAELPPFLKKLGANPCWYRLRRD
jgi:hypothetical protein